MFLSSFDKVVDETHDLLCLFVFAERFLNFIDIHGNFGSRIGILLEQFWLHRFLSRLVQFFVCVFVFLKVFFFRRICVERTNVFLLATSEFEQLFAIVALAVDLLEILADVVRHAEYPVEVSDATFLCFLTQLPRVVAHALALDFLEQAFSLVDETLVSDSRLLVCQREDGSALGLLNAGGLHELPHEATRLEIDAAGLEELGHAGVGRALHLAADVLEPVLGAHDLAADFVEDLARALAAVEHTGLERLAVLVQHVLAGLVGDGLVGHARLLVVQLLEQELVVLEQVFVVRHALDRAFGGQRAWTSGRPVVETVREEHRKQFGQQLGFVEVVDARADLLVDYVLIVFLEPLRQIFFERLESKLIGGTGVLLRDCLRVRFFRLDFRRGFFHQFFV